MPNLLIIDDHSIIRIGLKLIIESFIRDIHIDEAFDGDSAFEKVRQNNYDLVIMDVNMPNTDSFGLLSNLLAFKLQIKILMFSMNDESVYAKRFLKLGAMGYLKKDAPESEIKRAIMLILNDKKYVSEELNQKLLEGIGADNHENPFDKLSPREFEIVRHLILGESLSDICQKLILHSSTVGTHKARIFEKLNCSNVIDLSALAKLHNVA